MSKGMTYKLTKKMLGFEKGKILHFESSDILSKIRQALNMPDEAVFGEIITDIEKEADWNKPKIIGEIEYEALFGENRNNPNNPNNTNKGNNPNNPNTDAERDLDIKRLLTRERRTVMQLKYGIYNDQYYFGTVVQDKYSTRQAIITSKRKIYVDWGKDKKNEIKEEFNLNYRYAFEYDVLDNHISIKAIRDYHTGNDTPKSFQEVYEQILNINKRLIYRPDEIEHKMVSLFIMSSYFLPIYEAHGRWFIDSEKGSGKTRQSTIMKKLCCNAIMSADITKASFFRLMESTCGTLIIDDFDDLGEDQKRDVLQHYKTGYKPSSKTVRTSDTRTKYADSFRNYGACVGNNTTGIDDISRDRSYYDHMMKYEGEQTFEKLDETNPYWQSLTDDLYVLALNDWKRVEEMYKVITIDDFGGRKAEIALPFLTMAKLISQDVYDEVLNHLKDAFSRRTIFELESDWEFLAHKTLWEEELTEITMTELAKKVVLLLKKYNDLDANIDFVSRIRTTLGIKLRKLPFFKFLKPNNVSKLVIKSKDNYGKYLLAKGWAEHIQKLGLLGRLGLLAQKEVLNYLKQKGQAEVSEIAEHFGLSADEMKKHREYLLTNGLAYEPKPNHLRVIE